MGQFFIEASLFSVNFIKTVCNKPSFAAYNQQNNKVDILLYPIKTHIKADKFICNYYNKALKLINKKWDYEAAIYIKDKKFSKPILKLVTAIAKLCDIKDVHIDLVIKIT